MDRISENNMNENDNSIETIDKTNVDTNKQREINMDSNDEIKADKPGEFNENARKDINLESSSLNQEHDNISNDVDNSIDNKKDELKSSDNDKDTSDLTSSKHIDVNLKDKISATNTLNLGIDADSTSSNEKKASNANKKDDNVLYKERPTFSLQETLIMVLLTGIICTIASGTIVNHKYSTKNGTSYNTLLKDENIQEFLDVYATLNDSYYQSVDKKAAIEGAISGLMSSAGDNYTSYLDKDDAENLNESLNGKYEGIGIGISRTETGLIEKVYPNTPAAEAGLQKGDKITNINGQDISEMTSDNIAKLIKESANQKANLTVLRGEDTLEVEVEIKSLATPVVDYKVLEGNDKKVGYLLISSFSDTLASQVESALNDLESSGIESLILDLRNNGGGLLTAAKDTASLFLEKGKAIYGLEGNGKTSKTKFYYDETQTHRSYPIVVLVNGGTASASEILASALKDSYGATTVGTTTYGKGKVQQTKKLSDGSLVKYTTSRWLTPNNECIDEYGISPDYGVEIEYQYDDEENIIGYTDTQLAKARSLLGLPEYDETNSNADNGEIENNNQNGETAN